MKDKSFLKIRKKALEGNPQAQYYLSIAYEDGLRVERNHELSFYWCEKAATSGDAFAQFRLSHLYDTGKGLTHPDKHLAFKWLEQAAKNGHNKAKHKLAKRFIFGNSCNEKCCIQATNWFKSAAASGNAKSFYYLGFMQIYGLGCTKNPIRAFAYFKAGANLGNLDCQAAMGAMYDRGEGCKRNLGQAEYWYEKAATKGHAGAQFALAILYLGEGNNKSAALWNSIAANRGILPAQAFMAKFYTEGVGVEIDFSEALMWCLIGLNNSLIDLDSLNIINECHSYLMEQVSPKQFARAHEKAQLWLEIQNTNENRSIDWSSQIRWEIDQYKGELR